MPFNLYNLIIVSPENSVTIEHAEYETRKIKQVFS